VIGAATGASGFGAGKLASSVAKNAKQIGGFAGWVGNGVSKLIGATSWAHNLSSLGITAAGLCHVSFYGPDGNGQLGR
jgi:hypothetical protein